MLAILEKMKCVFDVNGVFIKRKPLFMLLEMSGYINSYSVENNKSSKKPFNKKKWREQKYSCKAKVQKWENIKRKQVQRQYIKECKKLHVNFKSKSENNGEKEKKTHNSFQQAQLQYKEIQKVIKEKRKEQERIRREKIEAIKAYKEKKAAKFRKLSQKTSKGQPLMKGRIEMLLEKIQKNYVIKETK